MYAEKSWDVEVQNGGWCYLDVFVNKQIHLIKAGCPWRFLLLSAHPTLFSAAMGISGYSKGQLGNGCLRCCFTRGSAPAGGDGANLEEGCFTAAWYFCHLVRSFSPAISKQRSQYPAALLPAQRRSSLLLLLQRGWGTNTLLPHSSTHLTLYVSGAQAT